MIVKMNFAQALVNLTSKKIPPTQFPDQDISQDTLGISIHSLSCLVLKTHTFSARRVLTCDNTGGFAWHRIFVCSVHLPSTHTDSASIPSLARVPLALCKNSIVFTWNSRLSNASPRIPQTARKSQLTTKQRPHQSRCRSLRRISSSFSW